ncbi:MAG: hypothetical protein V8R88_09940 [Faecalibacterium prausnitzii]
MRRSRLCCRAIWHRRCALRARSTGTIIINLCDAGGYRQFSNSKHPIKTTADLKGLKMPTNGMKTIDMTFQAMGATTTTIRTPTCTWA